MMTDYEELLRNTVAALPENNSRYREAVYRKARETLRSHVESIDPRVPTLELTMMEYGLEESISRVEAREPRDIVVFPITKEPRGMQTLIPFGIVALIVAGAALGFSNYRNSPSMSDVSQTTVVEPALVSLAAAD